MRKLSAPFLPQIAAKCVNMRRFLAKIALVGLAATVPVTASAQAALDGKWRNPKGTVVVRVARCGESYCGTVVQASAKARDSARKGGTPNLVGTRILSDLRATGDGTFRGRAFDPKRGIRAPATIRLLSPSTLSVRGCVLGGMICKEQRWTRVS
jgi:uncharacterized protein (DUF2147 family)